MKFSEMPYVRPDLEAMKAKGAETVERLKKAACGKEQERIYRDFETVSNSAETMGTIAYVRHSINTRDEFYAQEQDWMDQVGPPDGADPSGGKPRPSGFSLPG